MKKKKSLWNIFLIPILIIVFVQGAVPFLSLIFSGIRSNMENAVIGLDSHTVENRKVVLENDMIEQWSSVYKESDSLSSALTKVLSNHQMDMQGFMGSGRVQEEYLETVFYDMVEVLQYNSTSGIFLVLGNDGDTDSEGEYKGFWVRDSDPQTKTASRTDLLMERGSKVLSQNMSISLDTPWRTDFRFQGNGNRSADDFFYQPYVIAGDYVDANINMANLGYWSKPFILEDERLKEMTLSSIALNLFDREGNTSVVLDILALKLQQLLLTGETMENEPLIHPFANGNQDLVFHMADNGQHSSAYLLGLINDILDMSKIESGKMRLVEEKCNLLELVQGLQPLLESKIKEKQIQL